MSLLDTLRAWWPAVAAFANVMMAVVASGHAVVYKRDTRAAIGWVAVIWMVPFAGTLLYFALGINRVKRRAAALRAGIVVTDVAEPKLEDADSRTIAAMAAHLAPLVEVGRRVTGIPLLIGNRIEPLVDGTAAYPAMLDAIASASRSVWLTTYIFGNDHAGRMFVDALAAASERGVEVRVLIDAVGARYSVPPIHLELRRRGVRTALFMRTRLPWHVRYANLRSHRKLLVIDGARAFTGGMNIRAGNLLDGRSRNPVRDVHFRVGGPVVAELSRTFVLDWAFTTGETLASRPSAAESTAGDSLARAIADGPDEDLDKLPLVLAGALACARQRATIVTPYFLPDAQLISAVNGAALRGVDVDIVLPAHGNLRLVQWASMAGLWQVLERGCRVWLTPRPFDHSKLMVVDGIWVLIGSANWDPRSLRLNFELNLECYDSELAARVQSLADERIASARHVTKEVMDARPLPWKVRDGLARLLSPYL